MKFVKKKITKIILNKERESETIIEGHIINKDNAKVYLQGVEDSGKGKELKEKKYIEGNFLILLDKNNYNTLLEANYEFTQNYKIQGLEVKDLYTFISEDKNKNKYLVEI
jgi:hypothetical protein